MAIRHNQTRGANCVTPQSPVAKRFSWSSVAIIATIFGLLLRIQRAGRRAQPLTPQTFHPQRILVLRMDLIGDLVLSMPVVRLLKQTYPEAEIDLLALPASAKVVEGDPDIARLLTYDPNTWRRPKALLQKKNWREARALRQTMRERHYDLAVSVFGPWAGDSGDRQRGPQTRRLRCGELYRFYDR